ncbi:hypothetical protein QBC34DRAFT_385919 [Podospora aff. communis PSN243]|uniref:Uncharacterized protein n=1 Tax=Podospora aff. communis PSN243 TaxID=3040156 RepID=A0AAV9G5V6_9PEZI|nr:hypothetical protein QBC34DRAFT_385919 [Podospora aff. communis PSN243]
MKFLHLAQVAFALANLPGSWAAPGPVLFEAVSAPLDTRTVRELDLVERDDGRSASTLTARAPFPGLSAFLNFQSIGCGDPIDLIVPNIDVGACLTAVRGGLTWLIRSGDLVWQGQGPPPTQCRIRFFQERGCTGFSTVGELNICRNNQPNGFWSFRVTC